MKGLPREFREPANEKRSAASKRKRTKESRMIDRTMRMSLRMRAAEMKMKEIERRYFHVTGPISRDARDLAGPSLGPPRVPISIN